MTKNDSARGLPALVRSGGAPLMAFGLLGRLPTAMVPMLLLVAVPMGGASLVEAGSAVGAASLGTAASGIAIGLLVDRFGARAVVAVIAVLQAASLVALGANVGNLGSSGLLLPLALLVGLSNPAIGSLARATWSRRTNRASSSRRCWLRSSLRPRLNWPLRAWESWALLSIWASSA